MHRHLTSCGTSTCSTTTLITTRLTPSCSARSPANASPLFSSTSLTLRRAGRQYSSGKALMVGLVRLFPSMLGLLLTLPSLRKKGQAFQLIQRCSHPLTSLSPGADRPITDWRSCDDGLFRYMHTGWKHVPCLSISTALTPHYYQHSPATAFHPHTHPVLAPSRRYKPRLDDALLFLTPSSSVSTPCSDSRRYKPRLGDALLFWGVYPDGELDPRSMHGGCPVGGSQPEYCPHGLGDRHSGLRD